MAEAFIEAKNLRKTYQWAKLKSSALRGISFSVQRGEFVSVVGRRARKVDSLLPFGGLTRADGAV